MRDFPGDPWLGLGAFTAQGLGSIPGGETKIPQATQPKKKEKGVMRALTSWSYCQDEKTLC